MPELHFSLPANLLLAFAAYFVGCASPGPSILAIMTTAMSRGRPRALALAAGVMCGSLVWGVSAAFGLSALMQAYSWSLVVLKLLVAAQQPGLVTVRIGEETQVEQMRSASVVSTGYGSAGTVLGAMGVLGPTRMDYPGTIASVAAVARYIGEVLAGR